ncbi:MAG: DUF3256 family protein [Paramuribaculum sp.]|nr:DUF3256 family protein [Paramuribaculum sp.]MDE5835487.1 DUF3256 family protein [Paramuribaculum sp.]
MKLSRFFAVAFMLLLGAGGVFAQLTASRAFAEAPQSVFPLLDHNTRLDMIDYFNSGMTTASKNNMDGKSRITALTPNKVEISMTDASSYELALLPTANGDSVIALITTVATPAPDSQMAIFSKDWSKNITNGIFTKPVLADWLTDEGKDDISEVESIVPFMLVSYSYNPDNQQLEVINNTAKFMSPELYELVAPSLKKSMVFRWNGKKFVPES